MYGEHLHNNRSLDIFLLYTARNATDLLQVADFTGLLAGLHICRLAASCYNNLYGVNTTIQQLVFILFVVKNTFSRLPIVHPHKTNNYLRWYFLF